MDEVLLHTVPHGVHVGQLHAVVTPPVPLRDQEAAVGKGHDGLHVVGVHVAVQPVQELGAGIGSEVVAVDPCGLADDQGISRAAVQIAHAVHFRSQVSQLRQLSGIGIQLHEAELSGIVVGVIFVYVGDDPSAAGDADALDIGVLQICAAAEEDLPVGVQADEAVPGLGQDIAVSGKDQPGDIEIVVLAGGILQVRHGDAEEFLPLHVRVDQAAVLLPDVVLRVGPVVHILLLHVPDGSVRRDVDAVHVAFHAAAVLFVVFGFIGKGEELGQSAVRRHAVQLGAPDVLRLPGILLGGDLPVEAGGEVDRPICFLQVLDIGIPLDGGLQILHAVNVVQLDLLQALELLFQFLLRVFRLRGLTAGGRVPAGFLFAAARNQAQGQNQSQQQGQGALQMFHVFPPLPPGADNRYAISTMDPGICSRTCAMSVLGLY